MLTNPYLDITDEARRRAEDMSRRVWEKFGDLPNVDQDELKRRIDEFVSEFYPDRMKTVMEVRVEAVREEKVDE